MSFFDSDYLPTNYDRLLALVSAGAIWWLVYTRWTEAYGWITWPHRIANVLFWLAVVSFAWNACHWLTLDVWLPPAAP